LGKIIRFIPKKQPDFWIVFQKSGIIFGKSEKFVVFLQLILKD